MNRPATKPRTLSCGLLVQSPKGMFLAHAARTPRWDLPKGRIEEGETPVIAALRETYEETGLDLSYLRPKFVDHGQHPYIPKKDLHLFSVWVDEAFSLKDCHCTTYVEVERGRYLETDRWEWVPLDQVRQRLGKGMVQYLEAHGLLAPPVPERRPSP